ncbi:MAG: hypothetical protein VKK62_00980 [Synechococcaceae cyanobacterium]|nr:hypothetical protein [Synechococcaceae cyanobacterium]
MALTIALFALRAVSLGTPLIWLGQIPGWFLLVMVMVTIVLAARALLFPRRVVPWRDGEPGIWAEIHHDWRRLWNRRGR